MPLYSKAIIDYTLASLPAANLASGVTARIAGLGTGSALFYSNGSHWLPCGEVTLFVDNVGACFHKATSKYSSACSVGNGKRKHLGLYNTPQEAFAVYKPFKEALCKQLALKWQHEIDPRVYEAMMKWEVDITS